MGDNAALEAGVGGQSLEEDGNQVAKGSTQLGKLVSFEGAESYARLRRRFKVGERASIILGADVQIHPTSMPAMPVFELFYDWEREGKFVGTVHLNRTRVMLERHFKLRYRAISARLETAIGLSRTGEPLAGIRVHDIQPWPIVLGAGVLLLALGQKVHGHKAFGQFDIDVPLFNIESTSKVEARVSLSKGLQPLLRVHQVNPIIWVGHEGHQQEHLWDLGTVGSSASSRPPPL